MSTKHSNADVLGKPSYASPLPVHVLNSLTRRGNSNCIGTIAVLKESGCPTVSFLFNPKTVARQIDANDAIPADHFAIAKEWQELITSGRILSQKETALHGDFKSKIIQGLLGYTTPVAGGDYTVATEQSILRGSVDLALGHFSQERADIVAPLELKGAKTKDLDAIMPGRAKSPVQQAWEYATHAPGVKWVLVCNYVELRIYSFGSGTEAYERFDLATLTTPNEYARFLLILSANNLLSGKTATLLDESRREDKDITNALYADYKALRGTLIAAVREQLPSIEPLEAIAAAQTILDRVLFTAFAEDTGLLPDRILEKAFEHSDPFNPRPIWDNFKGLFSAIDRGNPQLNVPPYNGGLFAADPIVDQLNLPDAVCEGFKNLGAYDFGSEVSVTVLGHIFEQSIADVERLQAQARGEDVEPEKKTGTSGRRKRDGVVYTPDYIARFIVAQTLGTHIHEIFEDTFAAYVQKGSDLADYEAIKWRRKSAEREAWESYRDKLQRLRIVDPACGSGVFLVMAFDFMKAEISRVNDKVSELRASAGEAAPGLFDPDSEILTNNLFGVDVNAESVEIAKLSLWVKTARQGKPLDSLDANLKVGDSLIEDSSYAYLSHGFTWATAFPKVFAEGGFDIVLGNPPYVRQELLGGMKPYLKKRFEVYHGVVDLYAYFFERGLNLLKPGGRLGYISSNTFFKTGSGRPLRDFLRKKTKVEIAVNFGDLQIFEGVTTYPVIITMRREEPEDNDAIRFWNVEAIPQSNFRATFENVATDYPQAGLGSDSWELESGALKALREKLMWDKKSLKEVYGSPFRGALTGRNEAFVIDGNTRDQLIAEDPKSADLVEPWLEGKDIRRWSLESRDLWIIFTRRGVDIDAYPAIRAYLSDQRERLEPKPDNWVPENKRDKWKGRKRGNYKWFEIQDTVDYSNQFRQPRAVYPHFSVKPLFVHTQKESLSNDKTYIIPGPHLELTALLNSNITWFILTGYAPPVRGGFYEMRTPYIDAVPVPEMTLDEKASLGSLTSACQKLSEASFGIKQAITRRIPDLAPSGAEPKLSNKLKEWWTLPDFAAFRAEVKKCFKADIPLNERSAWEDWINRDKAEIARLSAEIKANEDQINAIVYELFDLTPNEIALLEANI